MTNILQSQRTVGFKFSCFNIKYINNKAILNFSKNIFIECHFVKLTLPESLFSRYFSWSNKYWVYKIRSREILLTLMSFGSVPETENESYMNSCIYNYIYIYSFIKGENIFHYAVKSKVHSNKLIV